MDPELKAGLLIAIGLLAVIVVMVLLARWARTGSKGDYIFRDSDDAGIEIVSIMFEMKNESDTTATKKKNEDFFKELDKDRNEKGCEYAVLVTLLEPDSTPRLTIPRLAQE